MVSTSALDKNHEKLFAALDYLYSDEGSLMYRAGLSKEQYAELKEAGRDFWDPTVTLTETEQKIACVSTATVKLSDVGGYYWDEEHEQYFFGKIST